MVFKSQGNVETQGVMMTASESSGFASSRVAGRPLLRQGSSGPFWAKDTEDRSPSAASGMIRSIHELRIWISVGLTQAESYFKGGGISWGPWGIPET